MSKLIRESEIEKHLVDVVRAHGGIAYKFVSPARRSVPDRLVLLPNRMFFVECKAPGKKPTQGQLREHKRIRDLGFTVYVVDSFDLEDIFNDGVCAKRISKADH